MLLLFFWYLATTLTGWINPSRFPRPDEVLKAFTFIQAEGYGNGKLHQHVLHSLKLVAMGFAVAVSVGVPLGLLMGYSRRAEALINPNLPPSKLKACSVTKLAGNVRPA